MKGENKGFMRWGDIDVRRGLINMTGFDRRIKSRLPGEWVDHGHRDGYLFVWVRNEREMDEEDILEV